MTDTIESLRRERDALAAELKALREQAEQDAMDAERYRMARHIAMADEDCQCKACLAAEAAPKVYTVDEFDAAIDAAILAAKGEGK